MLAHWFIYAIASTSLVAAAAVAAEHLFVVWRQPRRGTWLVALVTSIAIPVVVAARGRATALTLAAATRSQAPRIVDDRLLVATASRATTPRLANATTVIARRADPLLDDGILLRLWFAGSATLLALFAVAAERLRRESVRWRRERLDGVDVLVAPATGPAVVGVARPRIVLPEWTLSLDTASRKLILEHELEHIRARDPYLLLVAAMSLMLLPWNVALWFIARRLTLAVELDCDQRVLGAGGSVRDYGSLLLEVVRRRSARSLRLGTSLIQPRRFLARRIRSMLATTPRRPRLTAVALATTVILFTVSATRLPIPEPLRLVVSGRHLDNTHIRTHRSTTPESRRPDVVSLSTRLVTRGGPLPRITAHWENAPIDVVAAAFARFSGKSIRLAPDVNGLVTAQIVGERWDAALAHLMGMNGYRLIVHPDSSITIVSLRSSRPRSTERGAGSSSEIQRGGAGQTLVSSAESRNRPVSGSAIDEATNLPITGVTVNVVGIQAIGEPNRTCTSARGTFQLNVPDGEVWLDAHAPGYQFSRVILASRDSIGLFRGRRTQDVVVDSSATRLWLRGVSLPKGPTPLLVIDGAILTQRRLDLPPACVSQ